MPSQHASQLYGTGGWPTRPITFLSCNGSITFGRIVTHEQQRDRVYFVRSIY